MANRNVRCNVGKKKNLKRFFFFFQRCILPGMRIYTQTGRSWPVDSSTRCQASSLTSPSMLNAKSSSSTYDKSTIKLRYSRSPGLWLSLVSCFNSCQPLPSSSFIFFLHCRGRKVAEAIRNSTPWEPSASGLQYLEPDDQFVSKPRALQFVSNFRRQLCPSPASTIIT